MDESPQAPPSPCLLAIVVEGGVGLVAVGLGWLLSDPPAERIFWTAEASAVGLLATLPLIGAMWLLVRSSWRPLRELVKTIRQKVLPIFVGSRTWEFAVIAGFAGFGEEMLFRGVIQSFAGRPFAPPVDAIAGLVVASVLFGLLHWLTLTYAVVATAIGAYLGMLWILTDNLLVPALVHTLYDFWALIYLVRLGSSTPPREEG